jgi:DnaK suppressor protein
MNTRRTLTRQQLRELEAELVSERARMERAIDGEHASDGDWTVAGAGGNSTHVATLGLQTRADARYDAIVAAIARLEDGTYGICAGCQTAIPYGRLIVMPEVTSCLGCRSGG